MIFADGNMRFEISHQWEPGAEMATMAGVSCTDPFRMPEAIQCIDGDVLATTEVA